ncbi:MAG: hypothetical protein IPO62_13040 [Saprospiraceae bacterium]|nr:hypothetical protein [Saprospiraceae bacterium]
MRSIYLNPAEVIFFILLCLISNYSIAQCKFISISRGNNHVLGIATDGSLWAWGQNGYGQLGDGSFLDIKDPIKIGNSNDWQIVLANQESSYAINKNGSLWSWGGMIEGQLGIGTLMTMGLPQKSCN